ncbi:hypothetical protein N7508_002472 [Penicillium antarcticum]|uniref:uncharacterized protein n=1 Tax=Penicillium antarcticum TaxID=416450 RepID=UPI002392652A|nr:uncharacterized protein N7508_002472 [Penicillium antarcticum]KAJ5317964.1 hypothetical protein N7508_002472 [Penicillium antarcticum]
MALPLPAFLLPSSSLILPHLTQKALDTPMKLNSNKTLKRQKKKHERGQRYKQNKMEKKDA